MGCSFGEQAHNHDIRPFYQKWIEVVDLRVVRVCKIQLTAGHGFGRSPLFFGNPFAVVVGLAHAKLGIYNSRKKWEKFTGWQAQTFQKHGFCNVL